MKGEASETRAKYARRALTLAKINDVKFTVLPKNWYGAIAACHSGTIERVGK
jgi:hypothetical protein